MITKGLLYYTDNRLDSNIDRVVKKQLLKCSNDNELVSVSLSPIDFGKNIVVPLTRCALTLFKQILAGLEASTADIIYFCEHDVLYPVERFNFVPTQDDLYFYDTNWWKVDSITGQALQFLSGQLSGLCAYRELLVEHYRKRVERVEQVGYHASLTYEPGGHKFPRGIDNYEQHFYKGNTPMVDIRHNYNLTRVKWNREDYRDQSFIKDWKLSDEVPWWGITKGRFNEFLKDVEESI